MTRRHLLWIARKWPRCGSGLPHVPHALPFDMARVARWFFAASDITRLYILELLSQRARCVTELHEILDAPQSSVSFHLKVLKASGLVGVRRDGRRKYYSLEDGTLKHMISFTQIVSPGKHRGTCLWSCCQ